MTCNTKSGYFMLHSDSELKQSNILCFQKKRKSSIYLHAVTSISKTCCSKLWFTPPQKSKLLQKKLYATVLMNHLLQEKGIIYFGSYDIQNFQQCLLGAIFY